MNLVDPVLAEALVLFGANLAGILVPNLLSTASPKSALAYYLACVLANGAILALGFAMLNEAVVPAGNTAIPPPPSSPVLSPPVSQTSNGNTHSRLVAACFLGFVSPVLLDALSLAAFTARGTSWHVKLANLWNLIWVRGLNFRRNSGNARGGGELATTREREKEKTETTPLIDSREDESGEKCVYPTVPSSRLQIRLDFLHELWSYGEENRPRAAQWDLTLHAPTIIPRAPNEAYNGTIVEHTTRAHSHLHEVVMLVIVSTLVDNGFLSFAAGMLRHSRNLPALVALGLKQVLAFDNTAFVTVVGWGTRGGARLSPRLASSASSSTMASLPTSARLAHVEGAQREREEWAKRTLLFVHVLLSPICLALGRSFALSSDNPSAPTKRVMLAASAGILLHVGLSEYFIEEFISSEWRLKKAVAFASGLAAGAAFLFLY